MKRLGCRALLVITVVVATLSVSQAPASADTFPGWGHYADDLEHTFCFTTTVNPQRWQLYLDAMQYVDTSTDLYDSFSGGNCTTLTDLVYFEDDLPGTIRGQIGCTTSAAACPSFWTTMDVPQIYTDTVANSGDGDNFLINMSKTIRHETGHSMGLNNDGVPWNFTPTPVWLDTMVSGWVPSNFGFLVYSSHHTAHINAFYP